MRLHYLQHVPFEGIGNIGDWARAGGHGLSATRLFAADVLPSLDAFDLLVVLGGPMNVDDEARHPFLAEEKRFVERSIAGGKAVLGICLGSQLVASVLGARVGRNAHDEIGWFEVEASAEAAGSPLLAAVPKRFESFHWHGDTFEVPAGAARTFSSEGCANQGFVFGDRIVGVQFHPELTADGVRAMVENEGDGIAVGRFVQRPDALLDPMRPFAENARIAASILDALAVAIGA